jgi:hypothetical protein
LPQAGRIADFVSKNSGGAGIVPEDALGNLFNPLPVWQAFGVWGNADFRLPGPTGVGDWIWTAFAVALVLLGAVWMLRRGRWMLPIAAAGSLAIWAVSEQSQSPYVAAKALVIASPLLLAVAVVPLVEQLPERLPRSLRSPLRRAPGESMPWGLSALLLALLVLGVVISDVRALRTIPVGPTDHAEELRSLRPTIDGQRTLFLGNDDFIRWELAGVPVRTPVLGAQQELPIRAGKTWSEGEPHDFDSVGAAVLNRFRWVITTRDAAGSSPPTGLRPMRTTSSFALWRREGPIGRRSILAEGEMAGALLDCGSPTGRAVLRGGGVAAVAPRPVSVPGGFLPPGGSLSVPIDLAPGRWRLQLAYISRLPVEVSGPGLRVTLPPSLDRLGPRWPLGRLRVRGDQPIVLTFGIGDPLVLSDSAGSAVVTIVATRDVPRRVVPVRRACGRYVDWYRPSVTRGAGG